MMLEGEQPSAFANIPAWVHILTFLGAVGNQLSKHCGLRLVCLSTHGATPQALLPPALQQS